MTTSLSRRLAAEFLGTAFLVAAVIGSGVMGERLANGNVARDAEVQVVKPRPGLAVALDLRWPAGGGRA